MSGDVIDAAVAALQQGQVIAYPTEAVYGLGCDPFNEQAVQSLLQLKQRSVNKGLILIAADWSQCASLVHPLSDDKMKTVLASWPGPVTWLLPASDRVPTWIRGAHKTVALRVTAHPVASALCQTYGQVLVSTSANIEGQPPARDSDTVKDYFGEAVVAIVLGDLGDLAAPTVIRDAETGDIIRLGG